MNSYIIPTLSQKPENVILHSGANDLKFIKDSKQIAKNIINLALKSHSETTKVIISGLTPRRDKYANKVTQVNDVLQLECNKRNIEFINHDNIVPTYDCAACGVYLNYKGTNKLVENILCISNSLD